MTLARRHGRRGGVAALVTVVASLSPACASQPGTTPRCRDVRRMALVAQAVPGAGYLPCIDHLEEGWSDEGFTAERGGVTFRLEADRAGGRPVRVSLAASCATAPGVPTTPRAEGVRTSVNLRSITPRYAGSLVDQFPGGCVAYDFDFPRGAHIPLMEELQATVGLLARRELRLDLRRDLSVELDP